MRGMGSRRARCIIGKRMLSCGRRCRRVAENFAGATAVAQRVYRYLVSANCHSAERSRRNMRRRRRSQHSLRATSQRVSKVTNSLRRHDPQMKGPNIHIGRSHYFRVRSGVYHDQLLSAGRVLILTPDVRPPRGRRFGAALRSKTASKRVAIVIKRLIPTRKLGDKRQPDQWIFQPFDLWIVTICTRCLSLSRRICWLRHYCLARGYVAITSVPAHVHFPAAFRLL